MVRIVLIYVFDLQFVSKLVPGTSMPPANKTLRLYWSTTSHESSTIALKKLLCRATGLKLRQATSLATVPRVAFARNNASADDNDSHPSALQSQPYSAIARRIEPPSPLGYLSYSSLCSFAGEGYDPPLSLITLFISPICIFICSCLASHTLVLVSILYLSRNVHYYHA